MSLKFTGIQKVISSLQKEQRNYDRAAGRAMTDEAWDIMKKSMKIVPVKDGHLKRSGYVKRPIRTLFGPVVKIGYGKVYAFRQHEDLSLQHADGKTAKYLEKPIIEAQKGYLTRLASKIKKYK